MKKISLLSALLTASALVGLMGSRAIAQLSEQPFTGQINNILPDLFDADANAELPTYIPVQNTPESTFSNRSFPTFDSQNTSPSIDVFNNAPGVQVILINPLEQRFFDSYERSATTQLSNINVRSAVQAPLTQIEIRAGRPVVRRLSRTSRDSVFFNDGFSGSVYDDSDRFRISAISDLPDGNYRLLLSSSGIDDGGFVRDGRLFTFRKLGDRVTGNFEYIGTGERACVSGTLQGNTVFGNAVTNSPGVRVLDRTYLGNGLSLQMSDERNRSGNAVLSLGGFSFVNAGTVAPPTACQ